MKPGPKPRSLLDRLTERLVIDENGCHNWTGSTNRAGYGQVRINQPRTMRNVHRVVYETLRGPVPDGLVLDHLCRNRRCANPDHLEPVTNEENLLRGVPNASRSNRMKDGCPKCGGPYFLDRDGYRRCHPCQLATRRARYAARKQGASA